MPMALGHEAAGTVVGLGSGVTDFEVGDHVVLAFVPACGECEPCLSGRSALCEPGAAANAAGTLLGGGMRLRESGGGPVHHHLGVSAFSDHIVVSKRSAIKVDPELPFELAALFGCAVLTGVGAAVNAARIEADQSVAVLGLGGVGLSALLGAVLRNAGTIVAVDVVPDKLELALELGATHAVAAGPDAVERIREITDGGAEHVIETVGSARVLTDAYAATRRGGTTTTVGLPDPSQDICLPAVSLVAEERTLRGSYLGSSVPGRDIPRFIDLHRRGRLDVDRLLTHTLALGEINEGFDRLERGEAVRQAIVFD
jgi:alcohol dehydrogenase